MPRRLAALTLVLVTAVLAACSGGGSALPTLAPTLSLLNPSPTIRLGGSPTAAPSPSAPASSTAAPTPSPTPEPTPEPTPSPTPEPTPEPSASAEPSASDQALDPTSRDALIATLLEPRDVPEGLEAGELEEGDAVDDPAFAGNDGIRVIRLIWRGSTDDPVQAIYDYRYQFPDADAAGAFYAGAEDFLAETNVGMDLQQRYEADELGEEAVLYTGEVEGIDGFNYNYLTRVGNVVAKTWLTVPSTQDPDVPGSVASAAAARLRSVLGIEAPAVEFPNEAEAQVLKWIPAGIKPSCHSAEPIYSEEIETVRCDGATEHPPIDYSLFASKEAMDEAFDGDVEREEEAPTADGECAQGNYLASYTIEGEPAGRIVCTFYDAPDGKQYKVIEWTNENNNILTYMSSATRTWDELIKFWTDEAGPINDLLDIPSGRIGSPAGPG
jgi:hypothetical protein